MPAASLSAIIPVHNRRELVLRAIGSVLAQRAESLIEIIVVDDGSTDGTADAVTERFGADSRVRVLAGMHAGASAARNRGLREARGEFVCFLDSDDYWLPGALAEVERVFAHHPQSAFVSIDGVALATQQQPAIEHVVRRAPGWTHAQFARACLARECDVLSGDFFPAILFGDLFYLSGMVMRRTAALAAGPFNERFRYFNDWEFFARLCLTGPGAYVDADGFRRDTGRADQISRRRPATATARRQLYITRSLARRTDLAAYSATLLLARSDACYSMARALRHGPHSRWALRYVRYCLRRRYKFFRCLALLLTSPR